MKQFFCAALLLLSFTVLALGFCCVSFSTSDAGSPLSVRMLEDEAHTRIDVTVSSKLKGTVRDVLSAVGDSLRALPFFVRDGGEMLLDEAREVFSLFGDIGEADCKDGVYEI